MQKPRRYKEALREQALVQPAQRPPKRKLDTRKHQGHLHTDKIRRGHSKKAAVCMSRGGLKRNQPC